MKMVKRTVWHLEVTPHLNQQLEDYIEKDSFKTKSEFIRTAVRDRLEQERKKIEDSMHAESKSEFYRSNQVNG